MPENTADDIQLKLESLKTEHRDLDDVLIRLSQDRNADELQIRRLKKRKLQIKDMIASLERQAVADVTAKAG